MILTMTIFVIFFCNLSVLCEIFYADPDGGCNVFCNATLPCDLICCLGRTSWSESKKDKIFLYNGRYEMPSDFYTLNKSIDIIGSGRTVITSNSSFKVVYPSNWTERMEILVENISFSNLLPFSESINSEGKTSTLYYPFIFINETSSTNINLTLKSIVLKESNNENFVFLGGTFLAGLSIVNSKFEFGTNQKNNIVSLRNLDSVTISNLSIYNSSSIPEAEKIRFKPRLYFNGKFGCIFVENSIFTNVVGSVFFLDGISYGTLEEVKFENCVFDGCQNFYENNPGSITYNRGGSIYVESDSKHHVINIHNCSFINNRATRGGSVFIRDSKVINIVNSSFIESSSTSFGGGLYLLFNGLVNIYYSNISRCRSSNNGGGGGYLKDNLHVDIRNCIVDNNFVHDTGAGIYIYSTKTDGSTSSRIDRCKFERNKADTGGGALRVFESVIITNSEFLDNTGTDLGGGAIYGGNFFQSTKFSCDYIRIRNCFFSGSLGSNGGIRLQRVQGDITFQNVTIVGNNQRSSHEIRLVSMENVLLDNVTIFDSGGAAFIQSADELVIRNSKFYDIDARKSPYGDLVSPFNLRDIFKAGELQGVFILTKGIKVSNCIFSKNSGINGGVFFMTGRNLLTIENSSFTDNTAIDRGGALFSESQMYYYVEYSVVVRGVKLTSHDGIPGQIIKNTQFLSNTAMIGGSVFAKGMLNLLHFENCSFVNGSARRGFDIMLESSYYTKVVDSSFEDSHGSPCKIGFCDYNDALGSVHSYLSAVVVWNSTFRRIRGGGIYVSHGGYLDARNLKFSVMSEGRAVTLNEINPNDVSAQHIVMKREPRSPRIQDSTIENSTTFNSNIENYDSLKDSGGGILVRHSKAAVLIKNVQLIHCKSGLFGGGIFLEDNSEKYNVTLEGVETVMCSSLFGGGVAVKNTKVVYENSFLTKRLCSSRFIGDLSFVFGNEIGLVAGNTTKPGDLATTPAYIKLRSIQSDWSPSKNISCDATLKPINYNCLQKQNNLTKFIDIYPGESFDISVFVMDIHKNIVKYFPSFEIKIFGASKDYDTSLLTYNPVQRLLYESNSTKCSKEYIIFSNLLLLQKDIANTLKTPKKYLIYLEANSWIKEKFVIPVNLLPCPRGYYINILGDKQECKLCREKTYSVIKNAKICRECPRNAECGRSEVKTDVNYWNEVLDDGEVIVHKCVNQKCLGGNRCNGNYDEKMNICGACKNGYSEWNQECVLCKNSVNPGYLLIWIVLNSINAFFFHINNQETASSIEKIITFFFQTSSLIVPHVSGMGVLSQLFSFLFFFSAPQLVSKDTESCPFQRSSFLRLIMKSSVNPLSMAIVFVVYLLILLSVKCFVGCRQGKYIFCSISFKNFRFSRFSNDGDSSRNKHSSNSSNEDSEEEEEIKLKLQSEESYTTKISNGVRNIQREQEAFSTDQIPVVVENCSIGGEHEIKRSFSESESDFSSESDSDEDSSKESNIDLLKLVSVQKSFCGKCEIILKIVIRSIWQYAKSKLSYFGRVEYFKVSFFNLLVVIYVLFMVSALQYFACRKFYSDNKYYLLVNTDIKCYDAKYWAFSPFFIFLLMYAVLFPLCILLFLLFNWSRVRESIKLSSKELEDDPKILAKSIMESREVKTSKKCFGIIKKRNSVVLTKEEKDIVFVKRYGSFYYSYKISLALWYEVYLLYRRFFLVFFLITGKTFFSEFINGFLVIGLLILSLFFHLNYYPYKLVSENRIETLSLITLILLQVISSLITDIPDDDNESTTFSTVVLYMVYMPCFTICMIFKFSVIKKVISLVFYVIKLGCMKVYEIVLMETGLRKKENENNGEDEEDE